MNYLSRWEKIKGDGEGDHGSKKEGNPRIYEFYGQRPGVTQMGRKELEKCYFGASHDLEGRSIPSLKLCIIRFSFVGYFG